VKQEREIHIVYNFIGAFDFSTAAEQSKNPAEHGKTA